MSDGEDVAESEAVIEWATRRLRRALSAKACAEFDAWVIGLSMEEGYAVGEAAMKEELDRMDEEDCQANA